MRALDVASRGVTVNAMADTIKRLVSVQRAGKPDEVAALAGFLCSAEAGYITGQIISLNGD